MRVRVLAFASAGDALGAGELEVELPAGARVADLRAWLDGRYPLLAPLWPRLAVAVDGVVVDGGAILPEGAEVALLPPVSGGSGEAGGGADGAVPHPRVELVESPIDPQEVAARVAAPSCGATVLFLGTVRDRLGRRGAGRELPPVSGWEAAGVRGAGAGAGADADSDSDSDIAAEAGQAAAAAGRAVARLTYSAYRPMALAALGRIAAELEGGEAGLRGAIVHRLGEVGVGEPSVAIATAAPHRAAAYEANRRALERLKAEVPIWKREHYADGEAVWREEEPLAAAP